MSICRQSIQTAAIVAFLNLPLSLSASMPNVTGPTPQMTEAEARGAAEAAIRSEGFDLSAFQFDKREVQVIPIHPTYWWYFVFRGTSPGTWHRLEVAVKDSDKQHLIRLQTWPYDLGVLGEVKRMKPGS